jgi:hypothetical protein
MTYTARTAALVVEEVNDEALVYDTQTDIAHSLSKTAFAVWRACDEGATFDDVVNIVAKRGEKNTEAIAAAVLGELDEKNLLLPSQAGVSRRHALKRMAGVGAAAALTPFVVSVTVPTAHAAGSPPTCKTETQQCTGTTQATNNCCTTNPSGGRKLICGPNPGAGGGNTCQQCVAGGSGAANKPFGNNCVASNQYACCSGTCSGNFCAP